MSDRLIKGWYWVITATRQIETIRYFSGAMWRLYPSMPQPSKAPMRVLSRIPAHEELLANSAEVARLTRERDALHVHNSGCSACDAALTALLAPPSTSEPLNPQRHRIGEINYELLRRGAELSLEQYQQAARPLVAERDALYASIKQQSSSEPSADAAGGKMPNA